MDKTIERKIKIPRVRISDCCRLIFRLGEEPIWEDMNSAPDLFPIYPMPPMKRRVYTLFPTGDQINIHPGDTINDVSRRVCECLPPSGNAYLHTLIFRKDGTLETQIEII